MNQVDSGATDNFTPNDKWLESIGAFPIGDGHWLLWNLDGDLLWQDPNCRGMAVVDLTSGTRHRLLKGHRGSPHPPIEIQGSLLCTRCQAHGFVREGKWVQA